MSQFLVQIIIAASGGAGEDTFWSQILVLVLLAVVVGVGGLIKVRADRQKEHRQYYPEDIHGQHSWLHRQIETIRGLKDRCLGILFKTAQLRMVNKGQLFGFVARCKNKQDKMGAAGGRDLDSGMELLELGFLLGVIEKTQGGDENDVVMRKLGFNELLRRGQLCAADSKTLKIYAIDEGNFYGKDIQCEAMKELAGRTGLRSGDGFEMNENLQESAVDEPSEVRCS